MRIGINIEQVTGDMKMEEFDKELKENIELFKRIKGKSSASESSDFTLGKGLSNIESYKITGGGARRSYQKTGL